MSDDIINAVAALIVVFAALWAIILMVLAVLP